MVRTSLVLACVLGLGASVTPAQDTREKGPARPAERGAERPAAVQPSPAPGAAPSAVPVRPPSSPPGRTGMESRYRQYAEILLRQYDKNKNGVLEKDEWSQMPPLWHGADRNGDGIITLDELTSLFAERSRRATGMSGLPVPPPASVDVPSMSPMQSPARPTARDLGLSPEPLDPRAPLVGLRVLVAELAVDSPGPKSPGPGPAPAGSLPAAKSDGTVDLDLSASNEKLKEDLGKVGLRGRWEYFRNAQLSIAGGQVAYFNIGQSEPEITGVHQSQFGRGQSIQYKNIGFILGVKPHVDPGGVITVDVNVEASRIGSDAEGVPIFVPEKGDAVSARPLHTISSRTAIRVHEGKTVAVAWADRDTGARRRVLVVFLSAQLVKARTE